ncbi:MAG: hypothetical protein LBH35_10015 [Treponema sp.]|jgi:hypothetical protein|nr:hypothetical protein [Treponema sp.]
MKTRVYSIHDKLAEEYGPLFQAKNDEVALRNFQKLVVSQKLEESEFSLYFVGIFDTETGAIDVPEREAIVTPVSVAQSLARGEIL